MGASCGHCTCGRWDVPKIRHGVTDIRHVATGMRRDPLPIRKDSTHDAVRHGCYLACRARMLHVFLLFPLNSKKVSPVCYSLSQFVPVSPIYTQSQKLPGIHGVKSGSRIPGGAGRFLRSRWVTPFAQNPCSPASHLAMSSTLTPSMSYSPCLVRAISTLG